MPPASPTPNQLLRSAKPLAPGSTTMAGAPMTAKPRMATPAAVTRNPAWRPADDTWKHGPALFGSALQPASATGDEISIVAPSVTALVTEAATPTESVVAGVRLASSTAARKVHVASAVAQTPSAIASAVSPELSTVKVAAAAGDAAVRAAASANSGMACLAARAIGVTPLSTGGRPVCAPAQAGFQRPPDGCPKDRPLRRPGPSALARPRAARASRRGAGRGWCDRGSARHRGDQSRAG